MSKYFPRKRDNWSKHCDKEILKDFPITAYTDDKGQTYHTREHVYVSMGENENPYGIAFIHNFKERRDALYMDIRWYYRFRDLPLQLQSKIDVDIKENQAQCHSCNLTGNDPEHRIQTDIKDGDNSKPKKIIRFKGRELFASEILDTCLASFIVGRCCIVCYRDIKEAADFRPFVDTFYYLFTYNPHHRRLAATQGEIRVGAQYQADIPDLNIDEDHGSDSTVKTCCGKPYDGSSGRDDSPTEIRTHDENTTCSELSLDAAKRRKLWSSNDSVQIAKSNSVNENLMSDDDDIRDECPRWCANLAFEQLDASDFHAYTMAVRSIAIFSSTCEEGSYKSIPDDETQSALHFTYDNPWRNQLVSEDFVTQCSFDALHKAKYDFAKALDIIGSTSMISPLRKSWTEEDQKRFQRGIRQLGKNFYQIQKEVLPEKSLNEVVEFYYCWKKTVQGQMIRPKRRLKPMLQRRIKHPNGTTIANGVKTDRLTTTPTDDGIGGQTSEQDELKSDHDADSCSRCVNCSFLPPDSSGLRPMCIDNGKHQFYCLACLDHYKRYGYVPIDDLPVLDFDESLATGRLKDAMNSLIIRTSLKTSKDYSKSGNIITTTGRTSEIGEDFVSCESVDESTTQDLSFNSLNDHHRRKKRSQNADDVEDAKPASLDDSVSPVKSMEKMVLQATGNPKVDTSADRGSTGVESTPREIGPDPIACNVELFRSPKYKLVRILDRGQSDSCCRTDVVCVSRTRTGTQRRRSNDKSERQLCRRSSATEDKSVEKELDISPNQCTTESTSEVCRNGEWVKSEHSRPGSSSCSLSQSPPIFRTSSFRAPRSPNFINRQLVDHTRSDVTSTSATSPTAMLYNTHLHSKASATLVQSDAPALRQLREMALARSSKYTERKHNPLHHTGRNSTQVVSNARNRRSSPIPAQFNSVIGINNHHQQQQAAAMALQQYMQMAMEAGLSNSVQNDLYHNALVQSFLHSHGQAALQNPYIMSQIAGLINPNGIGQRPAEYDFGSLLPTMADSSRLHSSNGHNNRRQSPLSRDIQGSTHNHAHLHAHSHTHLHLNDVPHSSSQLIGGLPSQANQFLPQLMPSGRLDHPSLQSAASTNSSLSNANISSNPFLAAAFQQSGSTPAFGQPVASPSANFDFGMFAGPNNFPGPFRGSTVSSSLSSLLSGLTPGSDNSTSQMLLAGGTSTPLEILQAMGYPSLIPNSAYSAIGNSSSSIQDNQLASTLLPPSQFDVSSASNAQPPWYQNLSGQPNYHHLSNPNQQHAILNTALSMRSAGLPSDYPYQQLFQYQQQHQHQMLTGTTNSSHLGGFGTSRGSPGFQPLLGHSQLSSLAPTISAYRFPLPIVFEQSPKLKNHGGSEGGRVRCARSPICNASSFGEHSSKHSTSTSRRPSSQHPFTHSDRTPLQSRIASSTDFSESNSLNNDDIGRKSLNNAALSKRRRIDDSQRATTNLIDGKQSEYPEVPISGTE